MRRSLVILSVVWLLVLIGAVGAAGGAWLAGWKLNAVSTGSMAPEVPEGSLAIVAPVRPAAVEVGDVVTFTDPDDAERVILHRVVEIVGTIEEPMLRTQGDANATPDPGLVPARSIHGRLNTAVPHVGTAVLALQPPAGPAVLVGAPFALLLVGEGWRAVRRRPRPHRSSAGAGSAARLRRSAIQFEGQRSRG